MDNVNNLNGVPNFGHGEVIPIAPETPSVDEVKDSVETEAVRSEEVKPKKRR